MSNVKQPKSERNLFPFELKPALIIFLRSFEYYDSGHSPVNEDVPGLG